MAIRLGLSLPQARQYDLGRDVPDVARTAERIGYESLWATNARCSRIPRRRASAAWRESPGPTTTALSRSPWSH